MQQSIESYLKEGNPLCFIHVPKTAGTTLTAILESKFDRAKICPANFWIEINQLPRQELAQYQLFRGHFPYTIHKRLAPDTTYITVLRDPIERIISAYEFMKTCIPVRPESVITQRKARSMSLKDYLLDPDVPGMVNAQTRHIAGRELRKEYPDLTHPEWLDAAKENLDKFAFVGLTERFQDSIALLTYTFGWYPQAEIQNLMVGTKKLKRETLAPDVLEIILERNALDVELYDYAKARFEAQYDLMRQQLSDRYGDGTDRSLYSLLESHYEARYAAEQRSSATSLSFRFDQAMSGSGWQGWEGEGRGTAFRWTGPGTVSTLDFPLATDRDLTIELRLLNAIAPDVLDSFELSVNEQPIELMTLFRDEATVIFRGTIPQAALVSPKPFTRLTFQVNRTTSFQAIDPNYDDKRPIGLAFDLIQIFPVGTAPTIATTAFLFDSAPWQAVVEFLQQHLQPTERLFAPNVFRLHFAEQMPDAETRSAERLWNYGSTQIDQAKFDWVVLHKGMQTEIGPMLLQMLGSPFVPVYADEVFIVFSRRSDLPKLAYTYPHIRFAYTGYFKSWLAKQTAQPTEWLYRSLRYFRFLAKTLKRKVIS